jgi:mannose-6-phosphate isomerase-like protein (cupin superfamily)
VSATQKKRGISIFLATDAPYMAETNYSQLAADQLERLLPSSEAIGLGSETKVLVGDAGGFNLVHIWWKSNFPLPRHSHDVDCVYYVISGSANMGNRVLRAGDAFFVPAGAPYQYTAGPDGAEVLEVRHGHVHADMTIYETAEAYQQRTSEALEANREAWTRATVSPTYAANAGS